MPSSRRDRNIAGCQGWSFCFDEASREFDRWVVLPGDAVTLSGYVVNDGLQLGTAYVRAQFARSHLAPAAYANGQSAFDTHRATATRSAHRIVDIEVNQQKPWSADWIVPVDTKPGHFDFQVEVWNPPKLFDTPGAYLFHRTQSFGAFEVLDPQHISPELLAFVSYSHDSVEHRRWAMRLVEELLRHGIPTRFDTKDARIGERFDEFMSAGLATAPIVLLVCSEQYVAKAEAYDGGVGYEMKRIETLLAEGPGRIHVIPIYRANNEKRLPSSINTIHSVDMRGDEWQRAPLLDLVRTIKHLVPVRARPPEPVAIRRGFWSWLRR